MNTNTNNDTEATEVSATTGRTYPDVFSYAEVKEDNGAELGGAIADATEGLDDKSVFALVSSPDDLIEGWSTVVDLRDEGAYKDTPRVLVYQLPDVATLMQTEAGQQYVADAVTASLGRKIGAVARNTIAKVPSFPLPQNIEALISSIRSGSRGAGKKRHSLRAFRAVAGGIIKSLNGAYANQGVAIRFDTNGLKACLADANLAEAQHGSLPAAMWDKIFEVLESKIKDFVEAYEPKDPEKDPASLDLSKELAQLNEWKATRHDQAESGDIVIEEIDFGL